MNMVSQMFAEGGPLIYPLLAMMVWGLGIIVFEAFTLKREKVIGPEVVDEVERLLLAGKVAEATAYCKQHPVPMTRILLAGILNYQKGEAELKEILEHAGRQEVPVVRRNLTALGTIASVAPLLGLLGTVFGMIDVFAALARETMVSASTLAGGISEALLTTALGMVIAVPALAFHNFYIARAQRLILEMEKVSLHLVAVLKRS